MIPLSPNTTGRLRHIFAAEDHAEAERLLVEECGTNIPLCETADPKAMERIRFAALKMSRGSIGELRKWIALAQIDWRDLLVAAGFADDQTAHERWTP